MGSIFKYSGLTTKVRAMRAGFFDNEEYMRMAQMRSVGEVVDQLKKSKGYGEIFKGIDATDIHRGHLEMLLLCAKYRDYEKLYHFANVEQRKHMKLHFLDYEVEILKRAIVKAISGYDVGIIDGFQRILGKYSSIDIKAICEATDINGIIEATRDTMFYDTLMMVSGIEEPTEFDYRLALDLFFFGYVWKKRTKLFKGSELKHMSMNIGTEADTLNILWIHRAKKFYELTDEQVYAMIIPVYFRLKKDTIKRMVKSEDEGVFLDILAETYYGKYLDRQSFASGNAGLILEQYMVKCNQKYFKQDPYSFAAVNAYLKDKEAEIKKLITLVECVRYQYPLSEIVRQIQG